MNLKYLGEAVALLGIAYTIMRWVVRNVADADARPPTFSRGDHDGDPGRRRASGRDRGPSDASGTSDSDWLAVGLIEAGELRAAATLFDIRPEALERMDDRERVLLIRGYRAARRSARPGDSGDASGG